MNRTFLLMGPPGSGKGEQAKRIAATTGMTHIAMGSLIRHYCDISREGDICQQIERDYKAGIPQDDTITHRILCEFLSRIDTSKGVIFDAFPLSLNEAHTLPQIIERFALAEPTVIHIDCDEQTAITRISHRKICSNCGRTFTPGTVSYESDICDACGKALIQRADDREEIVRVRYKEYQTRIIQLLEYYQVQHYPIVTYHTGVGGPDEDFHTLREKLHGIGIDL